MTASPYLNIPEELRLLPNWVLWKLEYSNGLDKKPTKVPYQVNGYKASVMNASNWVTFEVAFNTLQLGNHTGLGFVFTNSYYSGIDLDSASCLPNGEPNPNYQADLNRQIKIAQEFDSYSEVSPSGNGLHIIVKGKVPDGRRTNFIELYPSGRFFTMTGNVHNNKPIGEYNDLLNSLWAQMGGVIEAPAIATNSKEIEEDGIIIQRSLGAANGERFKALNDGQWQSLYASQSEADFAYINIIAFYTQNTIQIARIFRASALGKRDKAKRKDYVEGMIKRSFDRQMPPIDFEGMKEAFDNKLKNGVAVELAPNDLELPPGLMGDIANFIYQVAPRPVKEVALAAAIGLMAGICGRAYNISGTGLNQYVLLLAMTGAGKEAMAEGIDKLMSELKMQLPTANYFIGPSEISSGSALFKYLGNTSQSFVSLLGEFGLRIKQLSAANANGAEVSLRRMILDLYNKSGDNRVLAASAYSKKEDSTSSIPSPSFSILGESTPERFYEVLNEDMISEGLLPRFLLIEYKGGRPANNEHRIGIRPTVSLIERLASLASACETINHTTPRRVLNVQANEQATKFLYEFDKYADLKINGPDRDVIKQLWNRAHIKVLKLAALVAVGENMIVPTINIHSVTWAANMVQNDIATLTARFEAGEIGSNTSELSQIKDITRIIREYATKDFSYASKYHAVEKMHKNKVISNTYLSLRLTRMASFRNDRLGGTIALKRAIQALIDNGKLISIGPVELVKAYSTTQKAYYIHETILE